MPIGDAGELKERSLSNYDWKCGKEYREIRYELCDGVAKISITVSGVNALRRSGRLMEIFATPSHNS